MLDESICHFRGVGSILSLLFYFWWKTLLASNVDPDQTPYYVASDRGLHYFHVTLSRISRYNVYKNGSNAYRGYTTSFIVKRT